MLDYRTVSLLLKPHQISNNPLTEQVLTKVKNGAIMQSSCYEQLYFSSKVGKKQNIHMTDIRQWKSLRAAPENAGSNPEIRYRGDAKALRRRLKGPCLLPLLIANAETRESIPVAHASRHRCWAANSSVVTAEAGRSFNGFRRPLYAVLA